MNVFCRIVQLAALVMVCLGPAGNAFSSTLPADIPLGKEAGRGGVVFVTIRLDDGTQLPFVLDTGNPTTCLDASLESKLGKRLRTKTLWAFGARSQIGVYPAPRLYLGKTLLAQSGDVVVTHDCRQMSAAVGHPIMGVLGMDILTNYCIQLDFDHRKIRFLDVEHANKSRWGDPFPFTYIQDGCPCINDNIIGAPGVGSLVDTGCSYDGWLIPQLFQQWTDNTAPPITGQTHAPDGILGTETYPGLRLRCVDPKLLSTGDAHIQFNGLGLHFLARHLVTLDFPEQTLYLKRTSVDALDQENRTASAKSDVEAAAKTLKGLEHAGQLPGWSRTDDMAVSKGTFVLNSGSVTFNVQKSANSIFHYRFTRARVQLSYDGPWELTKAWRTDTAGRFVQEFPVP
jgi:hypothetical protein